MSYEDDSVQNAAEGQQTDYDVILAQQSYSMKELKEHLTGPVIAIVSHLIMIPILLGIVIMPAAEDKPSVEIKTVEEVITPPEPEKLPELPDQEIIEKDVEVDRPMTEAEPTDMPDPGEVTISDPIPAEQMQTVLVTSDNNSKKVLDNLYIGRQGGKMGRVGSGGGSKKAQENVGKGLGWLTTHQNKDGTWGDRRGKPADFPGAPGTPYNGNEISPALTGLAMLCYFAHGETPTSRAYGETVRKGIEALCRYANNLDHNGVIYSDAHQYSHPIVTYALAEAAGMTKNPEAIKAMKQCARALFKGMNSAGFYDYNLARNENRSDLSYSGWCFQALKAIHTAAPADDPEFLAELNKTIDNAVKGLKAFQSQDGHFNYTQEGPSSRNAPTMTAVGALCLQLLDDPLSENVRRAVNHLETAGDGVLMRCQWKRLDGVAPYEHAWRLYCWYYQTQVFFQFAGGKGDNPSWAKWRNSFEKELVARQSKEDGHWVSPEFFDHDPGNQGSVAESNNSFYTEHNVKCYSTALCTLMLEVYYRHAPAVELKKKAEEQKKAIAKPDESQATTDELIQL